MEGGTPNIQDYSQQLFYLLALFLLTSLQKKKKCENDEKEREAVEVWCEKREGGIFSLTLIIVDS